jgi:hypothetical protein
MSDGGLSFETKTRVADLCSDEEDVAEAISSRIALMFSAIS